MSLLRGVCPLFFLPLWTLSLCAALSLSSRNEVTVDQNRGTNCARLSQSLINTTCSDLQDVLLSIASERTSHEPDGCIEVVVRSGNYLITEPVNISQNVILTGEEQVSVTFNLSDGFDPRLTFDPYYVFLFWSAEFVEMRGVEFSDSPGILAFQNITDVRIEDCSFSYFYQGAVDVYNCHNTTVLNCTFQHNGPVSIAKPEPYRGHAGGLSLGYYNDVIITSPTAKVTGCTFRNNTSDPSASLLQSTSQLFQRFIFTGRGGGSAITISPAFSLNALFEDCLFEDNFGRSFGGGLYVGFNGFLNHTVVVSRLRLVRNRTPGAAGGLEIGFVQATAVDGVNTLFAYNSEFVNNSASYGGGSYLFSPGPSNVNGGVSNFARFENCTFSGNTAQFGAAIGMITAIIFQSTENIRPFQIHSCTFLENDGGGGGAVGTAYLPLSFSGSNLWQGNRGRTLVLLGAHIEVRGTMQFTANNGEGIDGGALYVTSLSQMELFQNSSFSFDDNIGVLGASIVVDAHVVPQPFSQLQHNPLCFVLYEDPEEEPDNWDNVAFSFYGNRAVVASAVYLNNLRLCSWVRDRDPWFDEERVFRWTFVNFTGTNINTAHTPDELNPVWYVQTPAQEITVSTNVSAYPGEQFELGVETFDELGRPTAAVVRLSDEDGQVDFMFNPSVVTLERVNASGIKSSFFASAPSGVGDTDVITVDTILGELVRGDNFTIFPVDCPPGYVLSSAPLQAEFLSTCECNFNNPDIVDCQGRTVLLKDGLWGSVVDNSLGDSLVTYPCPSHYCRCVGDDDTQSCKFQFNSERPNDQCTCRREGVLCGSCRSGYGVSALQNRCVTCHDASGLLIAGLIVADAVVFVALLLVVRFFPTWLYPLSFYLQVLPYLTEHFPLTFEKVRSYLYYVSSASSFYFVYDFCLYGSMSALVSYFLRYLPLIVAVIVCTGFVIFRHYCKVYQRKPPWMGIWWMFLLQYTHVVHTSLSLLNCPMLPVDGKRSPRWFINGDVRCFTGGHILLGLLAIFVLACCVGVIPLVLAYSVGWLQRPRWLCHCIEPLMSGFRKRLKWWPAVELARRLLLLLFIVAIPQNDYPAILILSFIITIYGIVQPYKKPVYNLLEAVLSVDVLLLLLLRNTGQVVEELQSLSYQDDSESEMCSSVEGVTELSWLLFPFYYMPLVIAGGVIIAWTALWIRTHIMKKLPDHEEAEENIPSSEMAPRKVTMTELVLTTSGEISGVEAGLDAGRETIVVVSVRSTSTEKDTDTTPYELMD